MQAKLNGGKDEEIKNSLKDFDPYHLDCLLAPDKHPVVWRISDCLCGKGDCQNSCQFDAIKKDGKGNIAISEKECTGCGACIDVCKQNNLTGCRDILPVLELLRQSEDPVYAMIAPAFISPFSEAVAP